MTSDDAWPSPVPEPVVVRSLAGGAWVGGDAMMTRENPARPAQVVSRIAVAGPATVGRAVEAADAAGREWAATPVADRADALRRAVAEFSGLGDRVPLLETREVGKPLADSVSELSSVQFLAHVMIERAAAVLVSRSADVDGSKLRISRRPFGVVAGIVPWNAPLNLSIAKVVPALLGGNGVVIKPSPLAAAATTALLEVLATALPDGLLGIVQGGAATGAALVEHRLVRRVSFTGGSAAGRAVLRSCAERLVPATMELGGNDAAVVLDDVRLDEALLRRAVTATFRTSGQVCMAAKRWYVHRDVAAEFVEGFREVADRLLVPGNPMLETTTIGPVATAAAQCRVNDLVADAEARGAQVVHLGAELGPDVVVDGGYFVRPALVTGAADEWPLVAEEQFGPAVTVSVYDTVDEAVARANGTEYGLASSVWSGDEERAFALAERLEAGYTFVNTHNVDGLAPDAPFGGVKGSGFGREFGSAGLDEYSSTHVTHFPVHAR